MSDPLGLFSDNSGADPLGLYSKPTDPVNQIPGLEHSVDSSSQVGADDSSAIDIARGVIEAGAATVTGIPATLAEAYGQLFGAAPGKVSSEFYQPRTEKGKEYTEAVGEFANYWLNPLMGGIGHFSPPEVPKIGKVKEVIPDIIKEADKTKVADPLGLFDKNAPLDIDLTKGPNMPEVMKMTPEGQGILNAEHDAYRQQYVDKIMDEKRQAVEKQIEADRQEAAQFDIEQRQLALEAEVKRNAGLDYNAAERTRQAEADLPPARDPILDDPNVPQEHKDWYQNLLDEVTDNKQNTSGTPAFMEPNARFPNPAGPRRLRVPRQQRGAVNPEVFKEGYQKLKQLADGTWLRAFGDGQALNIEARKDGHVLGQTTFDSKYTATDRNLEAFHTGVNHDQRGKGLATEMYKFASELGNDIQASDVQTAAGKAMWDGFERRGLADKGMIKSPGNKQRGALLIGARKQLEKVVGKQDNMIPEHPNIDAAIEQAHGEKDSKSINLLESGSTLAAMRRSRTGATVVDTVSKYIQNAEKRADLSIRKTVFPVEQAFRALSKSELTSVTNILKEEAARNERFSPELVQKLPVKMQVAYAHARAMLDDSLRVQNLAREAQGKSPITAREAYTSHMWEGDFRRPLYEAVLNEDGSPKLDAAGNIQKKLVWYLADHTKRGLEKQTQALLKQQPDLLHDPKMDHTVRYYKRQTDLQSAYTTMLDILGRDDPAVQKLQEAMESQTANEAASFLNQEKHFKEQTGVRGFIGDRPDTTGAIGKALGKDHNFSEALNFVQQQIQYSKNAYHWSEIQMASKDLKKLLNDPVLRQEQPNNINYAREYVKNAVGHGEAAVISHLQDAIRDLGVSPAQVSKAVGGLKTAFILQKLGASLRFFFTNMLQPANILPHLMSEEYGASRANIAVAIPVGISSGIAMAMGHYANFIMDIKKSDPNLAGFYSRAFRYAEDNGITSRSIYDESPIESSFSALGNAARIGGRTLSVPESFARSMAFMTAVQFLKDSGKYARDMDVFQKAEDLVNASMVDYRTAERPLIFSKLGVIGNFLNTLQTYPMNWYNQWINFGKEAAKGNVAPFMAAFALQYALAGAMGVPGFQDLDKLYQWLKNSVVSKYPTAYVKMRESPFWDDPKLWMLQNFGASSVYGALSEKTGVSMTSSITAPALSDMIQAPVGPAIDIGKQAINIGKAVVDPNKDNIAQAAMASAPVGLQGLVENSDALQGATWEQRGPNRLAMRPGNIADHQAVYERTPEETRLRSFGLRSTKESIGREVNYRIKDNEITSAEVARSIPNAFYAAAKTGDMAKARDLYEAQVKLTGKGISSQQLQTQIEQNYMTNAERAIGAAKTIQQFKDVAKVQAIRQQLEQEYKK